MIHLEATAVGSLGRAWTLSPAFRAEPSNTNRHLSEFWMVEAEVCFIDSVDSIILQKFTFKYIYKD
jgi:asparaginyl-tRNA synthetase